MLVAMASARHEHPTRLIPAVEADLGAVQRLVAAAALPLDGLARDFPAGFVVALAATGEVVGCAGVECHASDGLLRSLAVAADARGSGLGRRLVDDRCAWGRARGLSALYLLTTDAAAFFARLGFERWPRAAVAPAIQASDEFSRICPASATCMMRRLSA
jgi:N-acetylglutamate synthase-like GNAT family acetyltransferase